MYLRFTVGRIDRDSGRRLGIFIAAAELLDDGGLARSERRRLRLALEWFNENLDVPRCLKDWENRRALCWFKPAAAEALRSVWDLVEILREHEVHVCRFKAPDPGIVLYEDEWQVVAKPRRGQRHPW